MYVSDHREVKFKLECGIVLVDRVIKYALRSRIPGGRGGDENGMDIENSREACCKQSAGGQRN